ncbi:MAG: hypothetical protein HY287_15215 [Planctomycetes bacterium]|nr:hypothetical protein [Planctomycetota bacterium]MBI3835674.1 hypothetical protein [Planctomycetota bacterium]
MSRKQKLLIGAQAFLIGLGSAHTLAATTIKYVKASASGSNDGSTWANAWTDLQSALSWASNTSNCNASNTCQLWVAHGTYKPSASSSSVSFQLLSNVALYGGFAGTDSEKVLEQRPLDSDPYTIDDSVDSVLSGDIDSNDASGSAPDDSTRAGNSRNVVLLPTLPSAPETDLSAVLDGFTIYGGYEPGEAGDSGGGGIRINGSSRAIFRNCSVLSNYAKNGGGGVYSPESPNASYFVYCTIAYNKAGHGGALAGKGHPPHFIYNSQIVGNQALDDGGGLSLTEGGGAPHIVNTLIARNTAGVSGFGGSGGGIFINDAGDNTLAVTTENCTIAFNKASGGVGGGVEVEFASATIQNSIVWSNEASSGAQIGNSVGTANVAYSDVQGHCSSATSQSCTIASDCPTSPPNQTCVPSFSGSGNITADPKFITSAAKGTDGIWGTSDDTVGNMQLQSTSPCIDAGSNVDVLADEVDVDQNGNITEKVPRDLIKDLRFVNAPVTDTGQTATGYPHVVDMGAYEYRACSSDSDCDNGDECHPTCFSGICYPGPAIAVLDPNNLPEPQNNHSLWRLSKNIIRIHFLTSLQAVPGAGEVLIQELLTNGAFGSDISSKFTFAVENGTTLKIQQTGDNASDSLQHRHWYGIRNVGDWDCVGNFEIDYVVQEGDVNDDGKVQTPDAQAVYPKIPCVVNCGDNKREDVNGDQKIQTNDAQAVYPRIPSLEVLKPCGHGTTCP